MRRRAMANEVRTVVSDFGADPYAVARYNALLAEAMSRNLGYGSHVYLGDRGDLASGQSFGGPMASPQPFVSAAPVLAGNPVTYTDASATIDTATSESAIGDPVARLLAQRLRDS